MSSPFEAKDFCDRVIAQDGSGDIAVKRKGRGSVTSERQRELRDSDGNGIISSERAGATATDSPHLLASLVAHKQNSPIHRHSPK